MFRRDGRFASALAALDRRDFARAEAEFSALLEEELAPSERVLGLNKRGVARIGMERPQDARDDFLSALAVEPTYAPALTNLGNLALEEGDVAVAIERYQAAIAADDEYAVAHFNLGIAYKRSGRIADGVRALRQAQRLETRANAARSWRPARRR